MLFAVAALVIVVLSVGDTGPWVLLGLAGIVSAWKPVSIVRSGAKGRDLIAVLGGVGRAQLVFGVSFAVGLFIAYS